jgi:hypothetical protein
MFAYPIRTAALAAAAMIGLSGCAYNGLYSGVSVGLGNSGYYDPYYSGYGYGAGYSGYGYGFDPYWGWNDGFYYPGTGYYVYDRYRRAHHWTDAQRRYWEARRQRSLADGFRRIATDNWEDFNRSSTTSATRIERSADSPVRVERRGRIERSADRIRTERQQIRSSVRAERSSVRAERKSEARTERAGRSNGRGRDGNREE